jgi:acetyl-CoA carboxylase biotin carboxyl carrier protein
MTEKQASDVQRINELLDIMHEHDLDALTLKNGETTYELVRREPGLVAAAPAGAPAAPPPTPSPAANVKRVMAPLTGVFYSASSPDVEPFVSVGSRVNTGDVLCILEAMKLFNEIQSDYAGTIVRVIPQNGELVSQGEELYWIGP